jgi:hypothetical protein
MVMQYVEVARIHTCMPYPYADLVQEQTNSSGSPFALMSGGVAVGYQGFGQAFTSGAQIYYGVQDSAGNKETGLGQFVSGSVSRQMLLYSSTSGSPPVFQPGATIYHDAPAAFFNSVFASGSVTSGQLGNGTVVSGSVASGQIASPHIAAGGVLSGNIGSGQIGSAHLASGTIPVPFSLTSGAVTSGYIGNGAVNSGNVASGQIGAYHIAPGVLPQVNVSGNTGYLTPSFSATTAELVSGVQAVAVNTTVNSLWRAMAAVSGRMPAVGMVFDNVSSGQMAMVYTQGNYQNLASGTVSSVGLPLWVGQSGGIVQTSGGMCSGGWASGNVIQQVGTALTNSTMVLKMGDAYVAASGYFF